MLPKQLKPNTKPSIQRRYCVGILSISFFILSEILVTPNYIECSVKQDPKFIKDQNFTSQTKFLRSTT
uniref:Transmembrane protein n=1 Tax=Arabidopsis thaliana TaxID=3702 RepID=Q0WVL5_ARATH|nr:hypothetical protein [Arabidopsis thaliana]